MMHFKQILEYTEHWSIDADLFVYIKADCLQFAEGHSMQEVQEEVERDFDDFMLRALQDEWNDQKKKLFNTTFRTPDQSLALTSQSPSNQLALPGKCIYIVFIIMMLQAMWSFRSAGMHCRSEPADAWTSIFFEIVHLLMWHGHLRFQAWQCGK